MEKHGDVTLAIDVMFINRIPFVITTSRNIHVGTAELIKDMKNATLITSIEQVIRHILHRVSRLKQFLGMGNSNTYSKPFNRKVASLIYVQQMNMYQK